MRLAEGPLEVGEAEAAVPALPAISLLAAFSAAFLLFLCKNHSELSFVAAPGLNGGDKKGEKTQLFQRFLPSLFITNYSDTVLTSVRSV